MNNNEKQNAPSANNIILFVSKHSLHFHLTVEEFNKLLIELQKVQPFTSSIIDISENPEMAEKYKVDALPTLLVGSKRFIGIPETKRIMDEMDYTSSVS